ncbi:MAG: riboflavin synthase, partial [Parvularculaceae bacterium]|nr:riboflavin synthase [Parvularculaceae bacterium]
MFTGLIEELGKVKALQHTDEGVDLIVEASLTLEDAQLGDSIAVQGVCLTVSELGEG